MYTQILCQIAEIEDSDSKGFILNNNQSVFIVKKEGVIFAYKNSCPHLSIELEWEENQFLDIEKALIQCSTHGALFIIETGECISGPCLGKALKKVPVSIENNNIIVSYTD